jgi:hypothetical protein
VDLYPNRDAYGYLASALVLATFSMRSMWALDSRRSPAISPSSAMASWPISTRCCALLLPLNVIRLGQASRRCLDGAELPKGGAHTHSVPIGAAVKLERALVDRQAHDGYNMTVPLNRRLNRSSPVPPREAASAPR